MSKTMAFIAGFANGVAIGFFICAYFQSKENEQTYDPSMSGYVM